MIEASMQKREHLLMTYNKLLLANETKYNGYFIVRS